MDSTIILILVAAGMFAIIGGITLISHIYNLNEIKSKTVGDGQHGTARFSTKGELRKIYKFIPYEPRVWRKQAKKGKLKLPQGVILGVKKKKGVDYRCFLLSSTKTLLRSSCCFSVSPGQLDAPHLNS